MPHYDGDCNCSRRMLTDCECVAHVYGDGSGVDLTFCDWHRNGYAIVEGMNGSEHAIPAKVRAAFDTVLHFVFPERIRTGEPSVIEPRR